MTQNWTRIIFSALILIQSVAFADFPTGPDARTTPGSLCQHADQIRYPEHIAYCERSVSSGTKKRVIDIYEQQLGYTINTHGRGNFKIDHLIPLCAGGSNSLNNLWPQHKSVYQITDPLEPIVCEKMAQGKLLQRRAVELILEAKHDLNRAQEIIRAVQAL